MIARRPFLSRWLAGLAVCTIPLPALLTTAGCASGSTATSATPAANYPPILFVHGNGDSAALWSTTLWRFESNGWPKNRLYTIDLPYPQARDDDTKEQPGRSSTTEQREQLGAEIDRVLAATGAPQLVLFGNSRGGLTIRNVIAHGGAAGKVSHAILAGTPNHGVWVSPSFRPGNEFNGAGPFLKGLNTLKGADGQPLPEGADPATGVEVTPGPKWLTLRSDNNDKFAQADGTWLGNKDIRTQVSADGPALKGAENIVLPGRDHRETAYHPEAFAAAWRFLAGRAPTLDITPEDKIVLDGVVTGVTGAGPTNLPLVGAKVSVFAVDTTTGQRLGAPLIDDKTISEDGRWGPLQINSRTALEFVVTPTLAALSTTHIYRMPFARSSSLVHLRPERLLDTEKGAKAVVVFARPRGYFGLPRDTLVLDGKSPPPGITSGVAGAAISRLEVKDIDRSVAGEFRSGVLSERVAGWVWPARDKHISVLELHY
jgi:pimeloyl-ACP methyl ester carboxylesterase